MHNILWELNRAVFHTNRSLALSCWWRTNGKNYPCSRRRPSDCQYQDDWIDLDCLHTLFATQLVQVSGKKHCRTPKPGDDSYQSVSFWPKKCVLVIQVVLFLTLSPFHPCQWVGWQRWFEETVMLTPISTVPFRAIIWCQVLDLNFQTCLASPCPTPTLRLSAKVLWPGCPLHRHWMGEEGVLSSLNQAQSTESCC